MTEPMSEERLAEIRAEARALIARDYYDPVELLADLLVRQTQVKQLRAENAAMREIVRQVATSNPYGGWYPATNTPPGVVCRWCMERAQTPAQCQHDVECTWSRARALVAQWDTPEREGKR